jgi:hypothetical protein
MMMMMMMMMREINARHSDVALPILNEYGSILKIIRTRIR